MEQNNNLQEIQRLRAEQLLPIPPVETSEGAGTLPRAACVFRWREHVVRCQVAFLRVSGWLPTWAYDGSSRADSTCKHVDTEWIFEPRHGRTAQVHTRHADKRTRTADHPSTAMWSTGIPRSCSKVQSAFTSTFLGTAALDHAFRFRAGASWCHTSNDCVWETRWRITPPWDRQWKAQWRASHGSQGHSTPMREAPMEIDAVFGDKQ